MFRFVITVLFIAIQSPFFITVLFYNFIVFPSWNRFMKRNRALFATLSISMWIPWLGLRVAIQPSLQLPEPSRRCRIMFLCTHQSFSDALVLALVFWLLRHQLGPGVALYKKELGKAPVLAQLQRYSGNIPVARSGDVEAAKKSLCEAAQRSREGYHVSGFPEGSRRRTVSTGKRDQVSSLKKGFFHMVSEQDSFATTLIYPVVFVGSMRSWPMGRFVPVDGSEVTVRIGKPVEVGPSDHAMSVDELRDQFQTRLGDEVERSYEEKSNLSKVEISFLRVLGFEMICSCVPVIGSIAAFYYSL